MSPEENAISRTMDEPTMQEYMLSHFGPGSAEKKKQALLKAHPLNEETDAPIPEWAISLLKESRVGYRTRIKMVMMHHWDITGENPSWRFVQPRDMRNTPQRPASKEVLEFREKQRKKAEEYLSKHKINKE